MRRVCITLSLLFLVLAVIMVVRTATFTSPHVEVTPAEPAALDHDGALARFSKAIQFKTISHQDPAQFPAEEFEKFRNYLVETFPWVHKAMQREIINSNALLYTWIGSDATLPPIILIAHYDVVPIDPGSESKWTHPPFSGEIADGYIWGRGTMDFKVGVVGLLEACETLLKAGFQPHRTIHLAFGHDEEIGGLQGAAQIAKTLKERGVKAFFLMDEGGAITSGILPGIKDPVALICLGEKGYVSLELIVEGKGGHSSQPPKETNIGLLARAIERLETHQMPMRLEGPFREMLEYTGPKMNWPLRFVMANLWALSPVVKWQLSKLPAAAAALHTTTAPTIIEAGAKENVLPIRARAVVNFRLLPGDTVQEVLEHAQSVVDDARVKIGVLSPEEAHDASPVSPTNSPAYQLIARSLREMAPDAIVAPGISLGGTDARHYTEVAEGCYRIEPIIVGERELALIHNTDERLSVENYLRAIQIYIRVIYNACS